MTLSDILLVFCLINATTAFAILRNDCYKSRTILQNGTYSDEYPRLKATLVSNTTKTAKECLANLGRYDIVETWRNSDKGLFNCHSYTLNPSGANRVVYHDAETCGDYSLNWITNANFRLDTYAGLPRRGPGFFSTNIAVSFNGKDDSFSIGNQAGGCSLNLDKCLEGVVYSFWIKNTISTQKHLSPEKRFFFSSGGHLEYSEGVAFYTEEGKQHWEFKSETQWWKANTGVYMATNRWMHLIATWSPKNGINIYQNGVEIFNDDDLQGNSSNYPETSSAPNGENKFVFGRASDRQDGITNAKFVLDDFRIYYYREINARDAKSLFLNRYSYADIS